MAVNVLNDFISDGSLVNTLVNEKKIGFAVNIKIPFYRSLPLSCIEAVKLKVNGTEVSQSNMVFSINAKKFMLTELQDLFAEWWFVHDRATLHVEQAGGLSAGDYEIEVIITLRGPYMNYHGDKYLTFTEAATKKLSVN